MTGKPEKILQPWKPRCPLKNDENWWLGDYFPVEMVPFSSDMLIFGGISIPLCPLSLSLKKMKKRGICI